MAKKFKKGDKVAVLSSWNNKGTVTIRRAIIEAFGPKICRCRDAVTGEMFRAAISTRPNNSGLVLEVMRDFNGLIIIPDTSSVELEMTAEYHGEKIREGNINRLQTILDNYTGTTPGYVDAIKRDIDILKASKPVARWHGDK